MRSLTSSPVCRTFIKSIFVFLTWNSVGIEKRGLKRFLVEISYLRVFHNENVMTSYGIPLKTNFQLFWLLMYPCLCMCMCIYIAMSSEICFLLYTEKAFFLRSHHLCMGFFWQKVGLFIYYSYYIWKSSTSAISFFSSWCHSATHSPTLSPSFVRDNACKSNSDLKVNLEESIKDIYSEKNWMALLIQRWLMALVNPAIAVGVCVLTDTTSEYWTEAGTCLGALVLVFHFLCWQLLKNAM